MTARTIFAIGTAPIAFAAALATAPAISAQDMSYEERVYEYAQPIPVGDAPLPETLPQQPVQQQYQQQPVDFRSNPVVQPIPAPAPVQQVRYVKAPAAYPAPVQQVRYVEQPTYAPAPQVIPQQAYVEPVRTRQVEYRDQYVPAPQYAPVHHAAPAPYYAAPHHAPVHAAPPHYGQPQHAPAAYDREAWLDECRDRNGGRRGNGGIIGGLLGAVAGGVAGNRIYDSERLAGTLIGAGVGGLAGLAIGSAISGSGRDRRGVDCEDYLERWEYQQQYGGGYYQGGYQQQSYGYTLVPVQVAVPQQAIVREYVTTEVYTDYEEVVVEQPHYTPASAPRPVKRQRYIKGN